MNSYGSTRSLLAGLVLSLVVALGAFPTQAQQNFSSEQVGEIEQIVKHYLLKNPEIIVEVLREAEAQQQRLADQRAKDIIAQSRNELDNDPNSVVGGNPDGDVTIVEFFDYRCGFCKRIFPTVLDLLDKDPKIRFVYKEFPILGPDSVVASRAAIASRPQGKYREFHDALMGSRGQLTEATVFQIAAEVGLDVDRLKEEMKAPEIDAILKRNYALAQRLGIRGTPSFVIGDQLVRGAVPRQELLAAVEAARTGCVTC